ncbi:hypothetical protein DASC09_021730 [Saccharomycopsis crataegensis]|uniref:Major facilitator superfamily (MFS) profile domain-containing protein n=1 Tax=Saccharomycopsis crataegensis TaxID=43959 RepID=A0AAV5QJ33_9ASCO|nr:hypothetical protein DASC09_021730 [Saccharomycopsis crataegensis]
MSCDEQKQTVVESEIQSEKSAYSGHTEVKYDQAEKIANVERFEGIDFDAEFEKLEALQVAAVNAPRTWWDHLVFGTNKEIIFKNRRHMTWMLGFFASMGGMLSGVDQSLISGANVSLVPDLSLTDHEQSLVSSLVPVGAILGSLIVSPLNQKIGRRICIMVACIMYTIGGLLCAFTPNVHGLYAGRIFIGVGIGLESVIPAYVGECAPADIRGNLVSLYQFNIALGEVFGYAIAAIFYEVHDAWRFILGSSLVFSTLLFIGMIFLPESPRYLVVTREKVGHGWRIWKILRDVDDIHNKMEFLDMLQSAEQAKLDDGTKKRFEVLDFIKNARARRSIIYANIIIFLGQFTGINGLLYYLSTVMHAIGFDTKNSVFMSLVGGGSLLIGTIPAILWMDKCGRRFWANFCLPWFFIGLVLVGIGYLLPTTTAASKGLYLTGVILYMIFFGSYSTLTWVTPAEVFPTYLRSYGTTITSTMLYLWSFIITYNFSSMFDKMTKTGLTLGFYGGIAVLGFIYQIMFVVETKGKSLEEVDDVFSKPTSFIIKQNLRSTREDVRDILSGNFKNVMYGKNVHY